MKYSLIWSSFGYLIVGLLGIGRVGIYCIPVFLLFAFSSLYHYNESNSFFLRMDYLCAWLVMGVNLFLVVGSYKVVRSIVGATCAFVSLWRYYKKGDRQVSHALRHILSACATGLIFYGYWRR